MTTKHLLPFESAARFDGRELARAAAKGGGDPKRTLELCRTYRRRGILALLAFGDPDRLRFYLHKSGRAYLHWLRSATEPPALSKGLPFFDAVAALDVEGALEIARRSPAERRKELEYEEDFLHVRFLMDHLSGAAEADPAAARATFERWEAALAGRPDPRLGVCRGLAARDVELFHASLDALLDEREAKTWRLWDLGRCVAEELATEGQVSVEGMALVILAERAGIPTREDYLLVPFPAREGAAPQMDPDAWLDVDA